MPALLFWLYLTNLTLLILHEMDSAYWREWELFRLPGGIGGFLAIHFPLYLLALYGVTQVQKLTLAGFTISLVVSAAGIFAFTIHTWFLRRGHAQFSTPGSRMLLGLCLLVSLIQAVLTVFVWVG